MESFRNRSKTILLNQEMNLKKSHRKICFHHGEKWFWKKISKTIWFFSIEKSIFSSKIFTWKNRNFSKFFWVFFKIIFLHDEKIVFDNFWSFEKVYVSTFDPYIFYGMKMIISNKLQRSKKRLQSEGRSWYSWCLSENGPLIVFALDRRRLDFRF